MLIPVILSGGSGTRLWPVSRSAYPKPFMTLSDGETLLAKTLARAKAIAKGGPMLTVTGRDYYFLTRDEFARYDGANMRYLLEPCGRNTAPALVAAALRIQAEFGDDAVLVILPSDHLIQAEADFLNAVDNAASLARSEHLVTFGLEPAYPETGYGYIRTGEPLANGGYRVDGFTEKPDLETAERYLDNGRYLWNSGMFCFTAGGFLQAAQVCAPEVYTGVTRAWEASDRSEEPFLLDAEQYERVPDISVDYAIFERADNIAAVGARFDWSDVGSWDAIADLHRRDARGNGREGDVIMVDCQRTHVQAEDRLVAAVGVSDLIVVDTDDAVLIAPRGQAQEVRRVVAQLKQRGDEREKFHRTVHRPWGSYTVYADEPGYKVKRLTVLPGQVLSLQRHAKRSEHWTVVGGVARVRRGDEEFDLQPNESTYIPVGTLHRLQNLHESEPCHLIEVQCGDYLGEDDIERFEDVYGRV